MAEEEILLVPSSSLGQVPASYVINFNGQQRQAAGIKYRLGQNAFSGPVALKIAMGQDTTSEPRLRRELEVARYLGARGGELLSKCLGHNFDHSPASTLVTYRGRPLADLARDQANWPLDHTLRMKIIIDLLQGVELLRISRIVHGAIGLNTLHWDGTTLQIVDFGQAALCATYPDGRHAHHGDDILAVGRVIYHVHTGQPPPADPAALRRQIEQVQDVELRDLLIRRDLVTGTDLYYVFDPDPDRRPTARELLDRLDRRPHGIQWRHLVAREQAIRQEFQQLRKRQEHFRSVYEPWAAAVAAERVRASVPIWPRSPVQGPRPSPTVPPVEWSRQPRLTTKDIVAIAVAVAFAIAVMLFLVLR